MCGSSSLGRFRKHAGITLLDALLEKFGGDSVNQLKSHMKSSAKY